MGNDGGSIPTRRELVKEAARNPSISDVKEKLKEHLAHRWTQCPISHKAIIKPVVSDHTGDLYNKDAIIQFLLPEDVSSLSNRSEADKFVQGRVKSLKDVVEVHFEVERDESSRSDRWICPVTSKELGPSTRAVYLVPCGHAFSQEAIREMKSNNECVQCGTKYESRDVVPILPSSEVDKSQVRERMVTLRDLGLTHSLKKDKSVGGKKRKTREVAKDENGIPESEDGGVEKSTATARKSTSNGGSGIKNEATADLTARVLEEEEAKKKRRLVMGENENISSLYSKASDPKSKNRDFMTRGFSIPANSKHR